MTTIHRSTLHGSRAIPRPETVLICVCYLKELHVHALQLRGSPGRYIPDDRHQRAAIYGVNQTYLHTQTPKPLAHRPECPPLFIDLVIPSVHAYTVVPKRILCSEKMIARTVGEEHLVIEGGCELAIREVVRFRAAVEVEETILGPWVVAEHVLR